MDPLQLIQKELEEDIVIPLNQKPRGRFDFDEVSERNRSLSFSSPSVVASPKKTNVINVTSVQNSTMQTSSVIVKVLPKFSSTPRSPVLEGKAISQEEKQNSNSSKMLKERVTAFEEIVKGPVIDLKRIGELSFDGIPEWTSLRSLCWKLLLGYLPNDRSQWVEVLLQKRELYHNWSTELTVDPRRTGVQNDHPLSTSKESQWNAFFKDKELVEEIDKDVKRTLPHLHFFNYDKYYGNTEHYEALKRILFIYAKLNPGIKYVQGMNEILGPIYYIFALDNETLFQGHAEPDAFFCFTNLMSEIRDNFCKTLDKSSVGIQSLIARLNTLLREKDIELWQAFETKKLNPQFYSFRWLTLLLSQEFELPDILRLWDSLFSDPFRFDFLLYVCCAMLICLREELLDGSFAENLKMLQNYPLQDISMILKKASELKEDSYVPPPRIQSNKQTKSHATGTTSDDLFSHLKSVLFLGAVSSSSHAKYDKEVFYNVSEIDSLSEFVPPPVVDFGLPEPPKPFDNDDEDLSASHFSSVSTADSMPL